MLVSVFIGRLLSSLLWWLETFIFPMLFIHFQFILILFLSLSFKKCLSSLIFPTASLVLDLFIESNCIPFQLVFCKAGEAELFRCLPVRRDLCSLGHPRNVERRNVSPAHNMQPPSVPVARWTNLPGHWADGNVWKEMGLVCCVFFFSTWKQIPPPCKKHPTKKKTLKKFCWPQISFELFFSSETIFRFFHLLQTRADSKLLASDRLSSQKKKKTPKTQVSYTDCFSWKHISFVKLSGGRMSDCRRKSRSD